MKLEKIKFNTLKKASKPEKNVKVFSHGLAQTAERTAWKGNRRETNQGKHEAPFLRHKMYRVALLTEANRSGSLMKFESNMARSEL